MKKSREMRIMLAYGVIMVSLSQQRIVHPHWTLTYHWRFHTINSIISVYFIADIQTTDALSQQDYRKYSEIMSYRHIVNLNLAYEYQVRVVPYIYATASTDAIIRYFHMTQISLYIIQWYCSVSHLTSQ